MLTNCANPECNERFKYLGEGKLYLANPGDALDFTQQQLFERCSWLCKGCAERFEIQFLNGIPRVVPHRMKKAANV